MMSVPRGRYVSSAEERLAEIEERAFGRKKDAAAWSKAERTGTQAGFEAYLKAYPNGRYKEDARRKIASVATARPTTAQREEAAWEKANKQRTRGAYSGYLASYPKGRYAASAQETLDRSEPAPPQASPPRSNPATRAGQSSGPRFPSPDEPFVERLQGSGQ
jgi:hypothetical protein